jgi:hypothetical protein
VQRLKLREKHYYKFRARELVLSVMAMSPVKWFKNYFQYEDLFYLQIYFEMKKPNYEKYF